MRKYEDMTDEQLIASLRLGESEIMDYIMEKYKSLVRKKAKEMFLLGGDNDDLIQEGMIGLFKAVQSFDAERDAAFSTFAGLCVTRQMYSAIKSSHRRKHTPLNTYISLYETDDESEEKSGALIDSLVMNLQDTPEQIFLGKEMLETINCKLKGSLSVLEKQVLQLHLQGTDYQTIAKQLGKSAKTIDNALQRIKHKVQEILHV